MVTLAYLRNNVMGEFFKDLRVTIDREENMIKIYSTREWNANRIIAKFPANKKKAHHYYDPLYEIHIHPNWKSKYTNEFSAIIPCFEKDNATGLWEEYEFPTVDKIEDCIFQIIKLNLSDYYEHLADVEVNRMYQKNK